VIVENYRPDVKHRLGIDYEAITAINPRLVYGSISGFGQEGPYADRPGVDPIVQGMGVFRTKDGYITIAASRPMWRKLCLALGMPELLEQPEYATAASRVTHREALNAEIERVTQTQTSAAWIGILNQAGVPCGPIYTLEETFNDPQVQHLGIAQTVESPTLGPTTIIGQAFHLSRTPSRLVSAAPECGADTDDILRELGYGAEAIAALRARQVI
jgi:formyl-CoA transferase